MLEHQSSTAWHQWPPHQSKLSRRLCFHLPVQSFCKIAADPLLILRCLGLLGCWAAVGTRAGCSCAPAPDFCYKSQGDPQSDVCAAFPRAPPRLQQLFLNPHDCSSSGAAYRKEGEKGKKTTTTTTPLHSNLSCKFVHKQRQAKINNPFNYLP